jgi:hypothetical protein
MSECGPANLARRRPRWHRRASGLDELLPWNWHNSGARDSQGPDNGRDHVCTVSRVGVSIVLDPEEGRLGILVLGEESTTAFTRFGIDNVAELVLIYKASLLPHLV